MGQWTQSFQGWRTPENISQGVSGIFSLIIASQMRLTWALLVNGFGSPRKLTKMTPQMHLGQNDSGNEGFSAKPITCNHWSESLYKVFRIKCVHFRYLFLKATESNTIYFHYVLIPPSFQGSRNHTFLFIFSFLAVVMWSRGWQTDYKGLDSKIFWTLWAEWSLPPTPQFYST